MTKSCFQVDSFVNKNIKIIIYDFMYFYVFLTLKYDIIRQIKSFNKEEITWTEEEHASPKPV